MNIALWIVQGLLALVYLAAGGLKVVRPREQLVASGNFDWMKDSSDAGVKGVGLVEILSALGVILPRLTSASAHCVRCLASAAKTCWPTTATAANLPAAVRKNEEVVPVNAGSTWVLPSGVTAGR